MENHAELYRRTLKPGLTQAENTELAGHSYAAWRSDFSAEDMMLFRLNGPGGTPTFYVRSVKENEASKEPMPENSHVATYARGKAIFLVKTPMTDHFNMVHSLDATGSTVTLRPR